MQETQVPSLGQEDPLEKGTATHSSILGWRIPRIEEPGRLKSMGHNESDTTDQLLSFVSKALKFSHTMTGHYMLYTYICIQMWLYIYRQRQSKRVVYSQS